MHESRLTDASGDRAGFVRLGGFAILAGLVIHVVANGFLKNFPPEDPTADSWQDIWQKKQAPGLSYTDCVTSPLPASPYLRPFCS